MAPSSLQTRGPISSWSARCCTCSASGCGAALLLFSAAPPPAFTVRGLSVHGVWGGRRFRLLKGWPRASLLQRGSGMGIPIGMWLWLWAAQVSSEESEPACLPVAGEDCYRLLRRPQPALGAVIWCGRSHGRLLHTWNQQIQDALRDRLDDRSKTWIGAAAKALPEVSHPGKGESGAGAQRPNSSTAEEGQQQPIPVYSPGMCVIPHSASLTRPDAKPLRARPPPSLHKVGPPSPRGDRGGAAKLLTSRAQPGPADPSLRRGTPPTSVSRTLRVATLLPCQAPLLMAQLCSL